MSLKIFKFNQIDLENLHYDKPVDGSFVSPKEYKKGFHIVYLSYKNDKVSSSSNVPLLIEIPSLLLNEYDDQKHSILLPLIAKDNKHDSELNTFFANLDKTIIKDMSKILKLLKIKLSGISYNAILKFDENKSSEYKNGIIQLKINPTTKIYDPRREIIDLLNYSSVLTKGCYVGSIIELSSILINHEQIIVNIKLHQLRISYIVPKQIILSEYSFVDSEEEIVEDTKKTKLKSKLKPETVKENKQIVCQESNDSTESNDYNDSGNESNESDNSDNESDSEISDDESD